MYRSFSQPGNECDNLYTCSQCFDHLCLVRLIVKLGALHAGLAVNLGCPLLFYRFQLLQAFLTETTKPAEAENMDVRINS